MSRLRERRELREICERNKGENGVKSSLLDKSGEISIF